MTDEMPYELRVIKEVREDWMVHLGRHLKANCCIAASTTAVEVLTYFGVGATAVASDIVIFNAEGWELYQSEVLLTEWPESAWSVGAVHDQPVEGPGYNGHVVINIGDALLLDLAAPQFHRPSKGIYVPEPLALAIEPNTDMTRNLTGTGPHGTKVSYKLHPDKKRWKDTPDYRHRKDGAGAMIRRVRAKLDQGGVKI